MIIKLIKAKEGMEYDITQAVESVTWSGSVLSAGRTAEITYINAPYDHLITVPGIRIGDFLSVSEGAELFFGQFFSIERSSDTGTISYLAADMMKNLLESSGKYNFKNITPEAAARQVCADIQVPVGVIAETGIHITSMICNGIPYYDIIMGAYTQAFRKTGKKYNAFIQDRKLNIYEMNRTVSNYSLSDDLNIAKASVSENMDAVKNQIKIYDDRGRQIGEVRNDDSIQTFGIFQDIYTQEKGVDFNTAAKNLLKTEPEQTISLEAIGDKNCISSYCVSVKDSSVGLTGKYWIMSDKHIWKDGTYMMELELSFDCLMDEKEIETKE